MARFPVPSLLLALLLGVAGCPKPPPQQLDWVDAPAAGAIAGLVQGELARAKGDRRTLLVYVGAGWCEPCERFHRAAKEGKLDSTFAGLRLLAFDLDRDRERLVAAGYVSEMIPLLAVPGADGRGSGLQMEGSIKGDGAVGEMEPRLKAMLQRAETR